MVEWSFDTSDAHAARTARLEFARRVQALYGGNVDVMAAELVLGELIGNVVRYAPGPAHVKADFDERGVTIAVKDRGNGFAASAIEREIGLLRESGRGLAIVAQLVETMEIDCGERGGCCVRARLDVRGNECSCD